ncbi:hypothetical protein DMA12_34805 [Amycolatopsis balhimycina DSM 5908]|uniref:Uncharacterized protein n=1 Tax=Amycolatopsis balhimycina DSM 5908 TaxID=1081091 RepID=A0A428W4C7_AMYBA|nr:hypothetical protein [Amycolatopsis balhimycina]RSM37929.1 hypothetical protein DMA12_34805 [Amycolatopsis balhimycina DSM 5908]
MRSPSRPPGRRTTIALLALGLTSAILVAPAGGAAAAPPGGPPGAAAPAGSALPLTERAEWLHKIRIDANGEGDFHNGDKPSPFCFGFSEVPA